MDPEDKIRRYSLQERGKHAAQAHPGYYNVALEQGRRLTPPPNKLLYAVQRESMDHPENRIRRLSLQERGLPPFVQANPPQAEPGPSSANRHVSYPNGPGTKKMRRYSVCAVTRTQPHHPQYIGSSTVAIDNKIEQAMDLVKSHLMFAVREEVEVLKEQIAELIERNNQLEYENSILRAAASPETLAKLAQPRQQPPPSSS